MRIIGICDLGKFVVVDDDDDDEVEFCHVYISNNILTIRDIPGGP